MESKGGYKGGGSGGAQVESSVADICCKYQISAGLYFNWRDKFLEGESQALASRNGPDPSLW